MGRNRNRGFGRAFHPNGNTGSTSDRKTRRTSGRSEGKLRGIVVLVMVFALAVSAMTVRTEAASATLSVSATGAEVGETVEVTVSVKSNDYIGYVYVILNYDASILQAPSSDSVSGGSGTVTFIVGSDTADVKEASTTLSFTALKAGTSALTVDSGTWGIDNNGDSLTLNTSDSSVTVTAAYTASTDATLSSLKVTGTTAGGSSAAITLSPSFSKNTTSYTAAVESNITTAVTTATANDSKATVSISDASLALKTGTNTVTVKVTAESGDTKTYKVTITREEAETTTEEPTTEAPTEEETTEEETTEATEPITVTINGEERILLREFDETLLPEGFEMSEITWEGETIRSGHGIYKSLTLVCTTDINGENPKLYILQEDGTFLILRNYQTNAVLYTLLDAPEQDVPEGFSKTTLMMATDYAEDDEITVWQSVALPEYYLVYAMNWDGETGYYLYDSLEGTFQRYAGDVASEEEETTEPVTEEITTQVIIEETTTEEPTPTPTDAVAANSGTTDDTDAEKSGVWSYVVMALEAAAIVLLVIALARTKQNGKTPSGGGPNGDEPGKDRQDGGEPNGNEPGGDETHGTWFGETSLNAGAFGESSYGGDPADHVWSDTDGSDSTPSGGENPNRENPDSPEAAAEGTDSGDFNDSAAQEKTDEVSVNEYFSDFDEILAELDDEEE
ncbi:MAG: cadherin-like beta sandwich domain-containing protein [Lachnospiraceae bacterium]|nr:cadherin-like beta sandwich domain-containing protein [Lachnospiraceae bacterium]